MSEENSDLKYQISENLYLVGGKDAEEFIRRRKEKDKKLLDKFKSLSNHLD